MKNLNINDIVYLPHIKSLGTIVGIGHSREDEGFYDIKINIGGTDFVFCYYKSELERIQKCQ